MMKNTKSAIFFGLSCTALLVAAPLFAGAQSATSTADSNNFCGRLDTISAQLEKRIANRETQFRNAKNRRLEHFLDHATSTDERLAASRVRSDENRKAHYEALLDRADTDAEKQAVAQFRTTVDAAVAKRRAAIDAAVATFRNDVKAMIGSRRTGLEQAANEFRSGEQSALKEARDACTAGTSISVVRAKFNGRLRGLQREFERDRAAANRLGAGVSELARKRSEAFRKARQEFESAMQKARQDLKQAFNA